jgi:uncharacterized metal-binding protein
VSQKGIKKRENIERRVSREKIEKVIIIVKNIIERIKGMWSDYA